MSRSCEQRHLCHFVTNGEFLDVCAQSRKRCLSALVREPCNQRVSEVRASFKTLLTLRPQSHQRVAARRTEQSTPKRLFFHHLTRPHTRGSSQTFAGAATIPNTRHTSLALTSALITHYVLALSVGIEDPCLFSLLENSWEGAERLQQCTRRSAPPLRDRANMFFEQACSVCKFHKKTHFAARPTDMLSKLPGPEVVLNILPT